MNIDYSADDDYTPAASADEEDDVKEDAKPAEKDDKEEDKEDAEEMDFCELCGCGEEDDDELLRCEECGRLHCSSCRQYDDEGTPYCADCYEELEGE